ncbi:MAG: hypothetical protein GX963_03995 [Bacteroidales bacterium]|nr:hypothetical protein [Bacteroidales bacterium]
MISEGSFGRFSDLQYQNLLERVQTHDPIEFIENVPSYIGGTALISGVPVHKSFYFETKNALTIVKDNDSESGNEYKINSNID